jgi:hypothetical protein
VGVIGHVNRLTPNSRPEQGSLCKRRQARRCCYGDLLFIRFTLLHRVCRAVPGQAILVEREIELLEVFPDFLVGLDLFLLGWRQEIAPAGIEIAGFFLLDPFVLLFLCAVMFEVPVLDLGWFEGDTEPVTDTFQFDFRLFRQVVVRDD